MKNYIENNRYHEAGDFFAGMMEMRRRMPNEKGRIRLLLWFYRLFSLYGERPTYAFGWLVLLCLVFGLFYLACGITPNDTCNNELLEIQRSVFSLREIFNPLFWKDYGQALLVSFDIQALGRLEPYYEVMKKPILPLLKGIQTIFGTVFVSLFVLAMNRKFRRLKD